uniref:cation channel sperm-associated protein 2-like isoform X2 n=1 Tax=Myxine glutinosa TaxID=7769 RepID=UPI00358F6A8A
MVVQNVIPILSIAGGDAKDAGDANEMAETDAELNGNMFHSFMNLFQLLTFDHWHDLLENIWNSRNMSKTIPVIFIFAWIISAGFVFLAIFTGTLEFIFEATQNEKTRKQDEIKIRKEMQVEVETDTLGLQMRSPRDQSQGFQGRASLEMKLNDQAGKKHVHHKLKLNEKHNNVGTTMWSSNTLFQFYQWLGETQKMQEMKTKWKRQMQNSTAHHVTNPRDSKEVHHSR